MELSWKNGFERWNLVRIATPGDGHCLFHAIVNAFFPRYCNSKPEEKVKIVIAFRKELSEQLAIHYDRINKGITADFGKDVPEFSLSHMQKELNSNNSIGYGYIEFIGNTIEKDIYVLDGQNQDIYGLYKSDHSLSPTNGNRDSIVLCYINENHFELVGIKGKNGMIDTHFACSHSFIRFLHNRISK